MLWCSVYPASSPGLLCECVCLVLGACGGGDVCRVSYRCIGKALDLVSEYVMGVEEDKTKRTMQEVEERDSLVRERRTARKKPLGDTSFWCWIYFDTTYVYAST